MSANLQQQNEVWKPVAGDWDFSYEISSGGIIRYKIILKKGEKIIYPQIRLRSNGTSVGYKRCNLRSHQTSKTAYIHRLIAAAFIPNPQNLDQVNHVDGNSLNNTISNLEWSSAKENTAHAWDNGLVKRDATRITDAIILSVKRLRQKGLTHQAIADRHNIAKSNVSFILSGKRRFSNIQNATS